MLSNYVRKAEIGGVECYYCTVQKTSLPVTAGEDELARGCFLAGQETQAVNRVLFTPPSMVKMTVIPTWECNLRCRHCCVIDRLVKRDTHELDVGSLERFIVDLIAGYGTKQIRVVFCGGEPFLRPGCVTECLDMLDRVGEKHPDVRLHRTVTTNLSLDLTDEIVGCLSRMNMFAVSIDGLKKSHNWQRIPLDRKSLGDPFTKSVENIKALMLAGMRNKIHVQAAVKDEFTADILEFYRTFMRLGVPKKNIKYSGWHPTERTPEPSVAFLDHFYQGTKFTKPCCKFQCMGSFMVDSANLISTDFYTHEVVGRLGDRLEDIEANFQKVVRGTMPVLHDEKCRACPVLGYCWGGCINSAPLTGMNPSQYCNQPLLMEQVDEMFRSGQINVFKPNKYVATIPPEAVQIKRKLALATLKGKS